MKNRIKMLGRKMRLNHAPDYPFPTSKASPTPARWLMLFSVQTPGRFRSFPWKGVATANDSWNAPPHEAKKRECQVPFRDPHGR
jgi:hypothetical protein